MAVMPAQLPDLISATGHILSHNPQCVQASVAKNLRSEPGHFLTNRPHSGPSSRDIGGLVSSLDLAERAGHGHAQEQQAEGQQRQRRMGARQADGSPLGCLPSGPTFLLLLGLSN